MAIEYKIPRNGKKHPFGIGIERIIEAERVKKRYANIHEPTQWKEMRDHLEQVLGCNVEVTITTEPMENASATIPMLDNSNPFLTEAFIGDFRKGMDTEASWLVSREYKEAYSIGGFDLKRVRMTGAAKKLTVNFTIGLGFIHPKNKKRVLAEECCAIMLHEVGHIVQFILGVGFTGRTNFILAQLNARLMKIPDKDKRFKLYKAIEKKEMISLDDPEYIAESNDPNLPAMAIVNALRHDIRSEMDSSGYDITAAESMADSFAANMGYALPLALVLGKTMANRGLGYSNMLRYGLTSYMQGLCLYTLTALVIPGVIPAAIMSSGLLGWTIIGMVVNYDKREEIYDSPKDRIERLLLTTVARLQSFGTREELEVAEALLAEFNSYPDVPTSALQMYSEALTSSGRKHKKIREMQRGLEALAAHKLYIKALKFKLLSQGK